MRAPSVLLGAVLVCSVKAHPLCYYDDRPTDYDLVMTFCPEQQDGACCNPTEEAALQALYNSAGILSSTCAKYYKQVNMCIGEIDEMLAGHENLKGSFCTAFGAEPLKRGIFILCTSTTHAPTCFTRF